jgi:catechol 1,2-dioxygenase
MFGNSPVGLYENQDDAGRDELAGSSRPICGAHQLPAVKPAGYPVPTDGPGADAAQNRPTVPRISIFRFSRSFKTLITQVSPMTTSISKATSFGVTRALIGDYRCHDGGTTAGVTASGIPIIASSRKW